MERSPEHRRQRAGTTMTRPVAKLNSRIYWRLVTDSFSPLKQAQQRPTTRVSGPPSGLQQVPSQARRPTVRHTMSRQFTSRMEARSEKAATVSAGTNFSAPPFQTLKTRGAPRLSHSRRTSRSAPSLATASGGDGAGGGIAGEKRRRGDGERLGSPAGRAGPRSACGADESREERWRAEGEMDARGCQGPDASNRSVEGWRRGERRFAIVAQRSSWTDGTPTTGSPLSLPKGDLAASRFAREVP